MRYIPGTLYNWDQFLTGILAIFLTDPIDSLLSVPPFYFAKINDIILKLKEVGGFGAFFLCSIVGIGVITIFSSYGSTNLDDFSKITVYMLYAGFFPIFGNLQIYQSNFLNLGFWNSNYTREHCLTQNTDPYMCPHKNGVIFTLVVLCFYLILTNIVFINLLISTFG